MRNNYKSSELCLFVDKVLSIMYQRYGRIISFEHGANHVGSMTSCGTDHAHLHLVPFGESLIGDTENTNITWARCSASEIETVNNTGEYLFYCDLESHKKWAEHVGYLHFLESPISQYFRRVIAGRLGVGDIADYKRHPHIDLATKTRMLLSGLAA